MIREFFSSKIFLLLVTIAVVAAVIYAIFLVGSPGEQRALQMDQRRISDLQQISFAIDAYWQQNEELPQSFEDLANGNYHVSSIQDPETGERYEYRIIGERTYELCAMFNRASGDQRVPTAQPFSDTAWEHGAGRECFQREATARETQPRLL